MIRLFRSVAIIVAAVTFSAPLAFAEGPLPLPLPPLPNPFQGTPEEQAACRPDFARLCKGLKPEPAIALDCFKRNSGSLSGACRGVLQRHGQI